LDLNTWLLAHWFALLTMQISRPKVRKCIKKGSTDVTS
jgi:hypothetical protein